MDPDLLDEFATECGLSGPIRVEVSLKGDPAAQVFEFRQPFLLIGRRGGSDLLLDHWLVSRRHAYLQLIEGRFFCVDLGSRTGTHGGDATERSGWVDPVRAIQIGPYSVRPELPPLISREDAPLPVVTWTVPNRAGESARWTMNRGLALVGKSPACKIRIPEPDVSRFHCGLVLTSAGIWVIDLLSQRPVLINGEPVRLARVKPGDELQVGQHILVANYEQAAPPTRPAMGRSPVAASTAPPDPGVDQLPALTPTVMVPDNFWSAPGSFAVPEGPTPPGVDPTVNHLVQQFGAMQQQMFDQFHQTMMMMFEGFAALHRETSGSIREEFEEVRKLSQEIESLREETARLAEATTMSFQAPALLMTDLNRQPPVNGSSGPREAPATAPETDRTVKAHAKVVPPLPDPHVDIHAQLCERLNTIAAERQTRWQKILAMMARS